MGYRAISFKVFKIWMEWTVSCRHQAARRYTPSRLTFVHDGVTLNTACKEDTVHTVSLMFNGSQM